MESILEIELIADVKSFKLEEVDFGYSGKRWVSRGENPLGVDAVLKLFEYPVCELFGYLLASVVDIPAPRFRGVWFDRDVGLPSGKKIGASQIGILIEYLSGLNPLYLEGFGSDGQTQVMKYFLFELFGRDECSEIFRYDENVVILDLERTGPAMAVGWTTDWFLNQYVGYIEGSEDRLNEMFLLAEKYGVSEERLKLAVENMARISFDELLCRLSFSGHPEAELMSRVFVSAVVKRLVVFAELLNIPSVESSELDMLVNSLYTGG